MCRFPERYVLPAFQSAWSLDTTCSCIRLLARYPVFDPEAQHPDARPRRHSFTDARRTARGAPFPIWQWGGVPVQNAYIHGPLALSTSPAPYFAAESYSSCLPQLQVPPRWIRRNAILVKIVIKHFRQVATWHGIRAYTLDKNYTYATTPAAGKDARDTII